MSNAWFSSGLLLVLERPSDRECWRAYTEVFWVAPRLPKQQQNRESYENCQVGGQLSSKLLTSVRLDFAAMFGSLFAFGRSFAGGCHDEHSGDINHN